MVKNIKRLKIAFLLLTIVFLTGCTAAPAPAAEAVIPTVDTDEIVEMAVLTVEARLTENAPTLAPATQVPTATAVPTETEIPAPTNTPEPEITDTPEYVNKAEWVYTSTFPENRREFKPNEFFNIAWGIKNVGNITWHPDYRLVWVGGDRFTDVTEIRLGKAIAPGETCQFTLGAFGSEDMSAHTTYWQLYDQSGYLVPGGHVSFTYQPI